jgi:hypothetical protein
VNSNRSFLSKPSLAENQEELGANIAGHCTPGDEQGRCNIHTREFSSKKCVPQIFPALNWCSNSEGRNAESGPRYDTHERALKSSRYDGLTMTPTALCGVRTHLADSKGKDDLISSTDNRMDPRMTIRKHWQLPDKVAHPV